MRSVLSVHRLYVSKCRDVADRLGGCTTVRSELIAASTSILRHHQQQKLDYNPLGRILGQRHIPLEGSTGRSEEARSGAIWLKVSAGSKSASLQPHGVKPLGRDRREKGFHNNGGHGYEIVTRSGERGINATALEPQTRAD